MRIVGRWRSHLSYCCVAAIFALSGCGEKKQEAPHGDAAAGRAVAERSCQSCHAIGPDGDSPVTNAPAFRELVKRFPPEDLAEALGEGIVDAHSGAVQMPDIQLEPEQVDDLIAYLQTLQGEKKKS